MRPVRLTSCERMRRKDGPAGREGNEEVVAMSRLGMLVPVLREDAPVLLAILAVLVAAVAL